MRNSVAYSQEASRDPILIFTIGHSNHPVAHFISLLKKAGVNAVADVRSVPRSRHHPQYEQENLRNSLAGAGLAYVFLGHELGARPEDRSFYVDGQVDFGLLCASARFRNGIDRLLSGARRYQIAMMCAERDPLDCHRTFLVSRALREQGAEIRHILADGQVEDARSADERLLLAEQKAGLGQMSLFGPAAGGCCDPVQAAWAERIARMRPKWSRLRDRSTGDPEASP